MRKGDHIMIKTLYLSDLDGTLLDSNAELSAFSIQKLNKLIADGVNFSVATARTIATVAHILGDVKLHLPVILMNGVLVYDFESSSYIRKCTIPSEIVAKVLVALKSANSTAMLYKIQNDQQMTYFESSRNEHLGIFIAERQKRYQKDFCEVCFDDITLDDTIYFTLLDTRENLLPVYEALKDIDGLRMEMYLDIYSDTLWYLEIFSAKASKKTAALYLKEQLDVETMVGFGDNLNDLPLFEACDFCCAVANARDELKAVADVIIDENNDDGVVRWIESHVRQNIKV